LQEQLLTICVGRHCHGPKHNMKKTIKGLTLLSTYNVRCVSALISFRVQCTTSNFIPRAMHDEQFHFACNARRAISFRVQCTTSNFIPRAMHGEYFHSACNARRAFSFRVQCTASIFIPREKHGVFIYYTYNVRCCILCKTTFPLSFWGAVIVLVWYRIYRVPYLLLFVVARASSLAWAAPHADYRRLRLYYYYKFQVFSTTSTRAPEIDYHNRLDHLSFQEEQASIGRVQSTSIDQQASATSESKQSKQISTCFDH